MRLRLRKKGIHATRWISRADSLSSHIALDVAHTRASYWPGLDIGVYVLLHLLRLGRDTLGEWLIHRAVGDAGVQRNGDVVGDRASQRGPMPMGGQIQASTRAARD